MKTTIGPYNNWTMFEFKKFRVTLTHEACSLKLLEVTRIQTLNKLRIESKYFGLIIVREK
jgi:hypothetical protein